MKRNLGPRKKTRCYSRYVSLRMYPEHVKVINWLRKQEEDPPSGHEVVRRLIRQAVSDDLWKKFEEECRDEEK